MEEVPGHPALLVGLATADVGACADDDASRSGRVRQQPVLVGVAVEMVGAGAADGAGDGLSLFGWPRSRSARGPCVERVSISRTRPVSVSIDGQHAGVGQFELAGVDHLDAHHLVAAGRARRS